MADHDDAHAPPTSTDARRARWSRTASRRERPERRAEQRETVAGQLENQRVPEHHHQPGPTLPGQHSEAWLRSSIQAASRVGRTTRNSAESLRPAPPRTRAAKRSPTVRALLVRRHAAVDSRPPPRARHGRGRRRGCRGSRGTNGAIWRSGARLYWRRCLRRRVVNFRNGQGLRRIGLASAQVLHCAQHLRRQRGLRLLPLVSSARARPLST